MKEGWIVKKIKDICDKGTSNIAQNKLVGLSGDFPVFGASGYVQNVDFYHRDKPYIGVVKDGSGVGRVNIYPAYSSLLGTLQYILPKEGYLINYVAYALKGLNLAKYASGAAIPHIYFKDYGEEMISIPPLEEQTKIVEELDQLSNIIEKQRQQLSELDNLAQSIFYDMFVSGGTQWDKKALIEIYKFIDYRGKTPNKINSGVPLITARNIRKGFIDYSIREYISESDFIKRQSRGIAQKGDLLFTTEAPMGYAAIADLDVFSTGQRLISFQQKVEGIVSNVYVLYYLLSDNFQSELLKQATGATVKGIKGSKLERMQIPLPPLELQQLFAQKIEAIELEKEIIKQSIAETEDLFNSRMDYYFG